MNPSKREVEGCIYCGSTRPRTKREHVIPQAIGTFEHNWTLDCVCDDCNHFFSRELELVLGRDSAEGFLRIECGVKPARKAEKFLNRRMRATLRAPGPFQGARMEIRIPESGDTLAPIPVPQVAFRRPGEDWCYLVERELTAQALERVASGSEVEVKVLGKTEDVQRLRERLEALRFYVKERQYLSNESISDQSSVTVEYSFTVDKVLRRAAAKIIFNYAAKVLGCGSIRHPDFDALRQFVRFGEEPEPLVCVTRISILVGQEAATSRAHACGLEWIPDRRELRGVVSLFNEITYGIRICRSELRTWSQVASRHLFDPVKHTITNLPIT